MEAEPLPKPRPTDQLLSVGLFVATLVCVYWVYGSTWLGGDPFSDPTVARGAAKFAIGLMSVLLAHEMGHYLVARAHGFRLSLPYFLPVPMAFGTFGAIIRLKSLPRDRTGLLEMGAAGPLAGFAVVLVLLVLGLPGTEDAGAIVVMLPPGMDSLPPVVVPDPAELGPVWAFVERALQSPPLSWILPPPPAPDEQTFMIMANPLIMDLVGTLVLGHPPGRYATLDPLAMAAWVGCLITAINLVPIGQLDGGHVANALSPRLARRMSRLGVGLALLAGLVWGGWVVWGLLLLALGAWRPLPVPREPRPRARALVIAALTLLTFVLCFMPRPLETENVPRDRIHFLTADGRPVLPEAPN